MNAVTRAERARLVSPTVSFSLDGREVQASAQDTLLDVATREGIAIPHLCHRPGLAPEGNCRACMVEVKGERVLAAACCRQVQPGMVVATASSRALAAQRMVLELLQCDAPAQGHTLNNELDDWAARLGLAAPRLVSRAAPVPDLSHPAIAVNLEACIQCTRCVRACRDEQVNGVIGLAGRGAQLQIVFDMGDAMGASTCVGCGECVQVCPTGALTPAAQVALQRPDRQVDTLCPYCGVGCQVQVQVKDDRILHILGRDGPANHSRLCVKGRFGFDYVRHAHRLTVPLIRRDGAPKRVGAVSALFDPVSAMADFREASWAEALALAGSRLRQLRDTHGGKALAGFGSAKGSNEEAYLFQKLVRLGFGSNNVDHCTRLCHASSVAALLEGLGSGAVSNPVMDVTLADVVIVIGANPTVNHPVAATWIKNAVDNGTTLIVIDPRQSELARLAQHHLAFKPDTDVALLNALMYVIHEEGLANADFIARRTEGYEGLVANLQGFSPEAMAPLCGIPAATLRTVARLYARSRAAMILWGMGISQHVHGTDNARCLIALALMTGQVGRPGTGLHPLRGQNNVQGASDAGLIPMMFPDYQQVGDPAARARFAQAWRVPMQQLDSQPGLTVVEVMHAAREGRVKGLFVMGENPAMSDPDAGHARQALAALDLLLVQDIFLTETAALADVVFPASAFSEKTGSFTNTDRSVQLGRQALALPGQARQDLAILLALGHEMGVELAACTAAEANADIGAAAAIVFDEMRHTMPSIAGITWERLCLQGSVTYPCHDEGDAGEPVVFTHDFPTPSGRGRFVPAGLVSADELPDADYPVVLITGRQLEHWHTGSMTRRAGALHALEPEPVALIHPQDLARWGLLAGEMLTLESRRGSVSLYARADDSSAPGTVFVAFCWFEAAINLLTNPALDPVAKIPEFKYCAVRITAGGLVQAAS